MSEPLTPERVRERIASHNMTDAEYTRNLLAALAEVERLRAERDERYDQLMRSERDLHRERERAKRAEADAESLAEAASDPDLYRMDEYGNAAKNRLSEALRQHEEMKGADAMTHP